MTYVYNKYVCDEISIHSRISVHACEAYADSHIHTRTFYRILWHWKIESNPIDEWMTERTHKNVEHVEKTKPNKHMRVDVCVYARFLIIDYPSPDK